MKTKIKRKKNNKLRNSRKSRKHMKGGNKKIYSGYRRATKT